MSSIITTFRFELGAVKSGSSVGIEIDCDASREGLRVVLQYDDAYIITPDFFDVPSGSTRLRPNVEVSGPMGTLLVTARLALSEQVDTIRVMP